MSDDPPVLHTPRLAVRRAQPFMATALAHFLAGNWEGHLDRWSPPAGTAWFTQAFWQARLERAEIEWQAGLAARFVLQPHGPPDGPIIGTCNYTNVVRGAFQACYLGYQVGRAHQGLGYMTEVLVPLNAYVFRTLRLHRIMANYVPENTRSARLLERLGFAREGLAKEYLFIDGAWRDHVLTALTNREFDPAHIEMPGG